MKALCATGLLAATMTAGVMLPGQAADKMMDKKMDGKMAPKMEHKMDGKMMSCPACKMMGDKMSDGDKKMMEHMMSMMSAADKKAYGAIEGLKKP